MTTQGGKGGALANGEADGPVDSLAYKDLTVRDSVYRVGRCGSGPTVLLLHGFPQTHYCWRHIIPKLAEDHSIVATDLRGYGGTSAASGGPRGEGYSKREMANDLAELMRALGLTSYALVGHDRGARVGYRLALDHPRRVTRLAVLNVIPTLDQFERMGAGPSLGYWPWFLFAQPAPFPEQLITASPEQLLRFVFDSWSERRDAIDAIAFDVYLRALSDASVASICGDYRASFWIDREHDLDDRKAGRKIDCPLLVITGAAESQLADAGEVWSLWANDVTARRVPGGHFLPEEAPEEVAALLRTFLES